MSQAKRGCDASIAIIGMACRFPGGAASPNAYWRLLSKGVDATVDVPPERWDRERFFDPDPESNTHSDR